MQYNTTINHNIKLSFSGWFYTFHTSTESKYSQLFKNTLQCLTSCGAPLSFDSIYCRSVSWCIYDNYPLTHLLDLVHHSLRITGGWREQRQVEASSAHLIFAFCRLSPRVSYLQPRKTWLAHAVDRDSSLSRLLLGTPGSTVGKASMFLRMNSLRASHCFLVSQ